MTVLMGDGRKMNGGAGCVELLIENKIDGEHIVQGCFFFIFISSALDLTVQDA